MQSLPQDLLTYLTVSLPYALLGTFFRLCKRFYALSQDPVYWKDRLLREFPLHLDLSRLSIPFEIPDLHRLDQATVETYHNFLITAVKTISSNCSWKIPLDYESKTLEDLCDIVQRGWSVFKGLQTPLPRKDLPLDPRMRYIHLAYLRLKSLGEGYAIKRCKTHPEYLELKSKLNALESQFIKEENIINNNILAFQNYIQYYKFSPKYYRWNSSSTILKKLMCKGRFPFNELTSLLQEEGLNLEFSNGLLLGIFSTKRSNIPDYLIFFYISNTGRLDATYTETGEGEMPRLPVILKQMISKLGWKLSETYNLDFTVDVLE